METYRFVKEPTGRAELVTDQISVILGRLILGVFRVAAWVVGRLLGLAKQRPPKNGRPAPGHKSPSPKPAGRKGKKWG